MTLTVWQFLDYMVALKGAWSKLWLYFPGPGRHGSERQQKARFARCRRAASVSGWASPRPFSDRRSCHLGRAYRGAGPEERIRFQNFLPDKPRISWYCCPPTSSRTSSRCATRSSSSTMAGFFFTGTPELLHCPGAGPCGRLLEQPGYQHSPRSAHHLSLNTPDGVLCRGVAEQLPSQAEAAVPTLEDAYLYLITQEAGQ